MTGDWNSSWNKGVRQTTCKRGHSDWVFDNRGQRRCRPCTIERKRRGRRRAGTPNKNAGWSDPNRLGDRGPREETMTYSEIMKARGYIAAS